MVSDAPFPIFKAIRHIFFTIVTFFVLIFFPARTLCWWRGWVVMALVVIGSVGSFLLLLPGHKDMLRERLKPPVQKGQPLIDKIVLLTFIVSWNLFEIVAPLDVFHFHLAPRPPLLVSSIGLACFMAGWYVVFLALRDNSFAAPVVRHQEERSQTVVDQGVYRYVRHPMYAGLILAMFGIPLWLESYAGAIAAVVPSGLLIARIFLEERFLRAKLEGYGGYIGRVKYRLVPGVW